MRIQSILNVGGQTDLTPAVVPERDHKVRDTRKSLTSKTIRSSLESAGHPQWESKIS